MQPEVYLEVRPSVAALVGLSGDIGPVVKRALNKAGNAYKREQQNNMRGGGENLHRRTGSLARSMWTKATDDALYTGFGVNYWAIHEFGETIYGSPWLTVPLDEVKTKAGVARYNIGEAISAYPNTFFKESKTTPGNLVLLSSQGDQVVPLFALVRQVRIEPRLKARETFQKVAPPVFERSIIEQMDAAVNARRKQGKFL